MDDRAELVDAKLAGPTTPRRWSGENDNHTSEVVSKKKEKAPKGVWVIGVGIILGSIFGLLNTMSSFEFNTKISAYFYLVAQPLSIVGAVLLIKLKKLGRVVIIAISLLTIIETVATLGYVSKNIQTKMTPVLTEQSLAQMSAQLKATQGKDIPITPEIKAKIEDMMHTMVSVALNSMVTMSVMFGLVVIYYLSLPAIRRYYT